MNWSMQPTSEIKKMISPSSLPWDDIVAKNIVVCIKREDIASSTLRVYATFMGRKLNRKFSVKVNTKEDTYEVGLRPEALTPAYTFKKTKGSYSQRAAIYNLWASYLNELGWGASAYIDPAGMCINIYFRDAKPLLALIASTDPLSEQEKGFIANGAATFETKEQLREALLGYVNAHSLGNPEGSVRTQTLITAPVVRSENQSQTDTVADDEEFS